MKKLIILAIILTLSVTLIACTNNGKEETTTTAGDVVTQAETVSDTASEEETAAEENGINLSGRRIALSDYASDYDEMLAERVSELIGSEIISDTDASAENPIYIGWTGSVTNSDFNLDAIGDEGYLIQLYDGKLVIASNGEAGMNNVYDYLNKNIVKEGDKVKLPMDKLVKQTANSENPATVSISGSMEKSVAYAGTLENAIKEAFIGDGTRSVLDFSNLTMKLKYTLISDSDKYVAEFTNTQGVPYFINSSDVYVTNTSGVKMYASGSSFSGRMNTYRMGYYYRDIHVLDQNFIAMGSSEGDGITDSLDILAKIKKYNTNMTSAVTKTDDGGIQFTVEDPYDPYITMNVSYKTSAYNALRITISSENCSGAELYYISGKHSGYSSEQRISFDITPDGEYHTYIISFEGAVDYTNKVGGLRIDVGTKAGEQIRIKSLEAVNIDYYSAGVQLDRTYHTYSDKLNEELHFVVTKETNELAEYGVETVIDASRVRGIRIADKNGVHETLDGVDFDSVEYVGFDIVRAGIIGWIKCVDTDEAKFGVKLEDGKYTVAVYTAIGEGKTFKYGDELYIGYRIYNDETHSFDEFLNQAYIERHPLTDVQMLATADNARYVGYDALRGCYTFMIDGTNFNIYYKDKQRNFLISAKISGDKVERKIYVLGAGESGCLENAVLLDENQLLMPLALEVCKNFEGENEEPLFDAGDPEYGEVIFPIVIEADKSETFNLIHLYTNWGAFPIKQLSSIQFIAPYYHLSCGTTESNCIAPYYVYGKDYWTLPDFRAMSAPFWSGQPQHTSIGRLHWLTYTDANNKFHGTEFVSDVIDSSGPTYADIDMDYISDDGKIKASYRHVEMPQYDENRTYYQMELEVLDDITINDFKSNFSLFSFDGRDKLFRKAGYLNTDNKCVTEDLDLSAPYTRYITLGTEGAYFDYYMSDGDYVNFALLIKNSKIMINGQEVKAPFVIKDEYDGALNNCYLTLDLGNVTLHKGDVFSIEIILMPWGSQLVSNDQSVRTVREDSCLNPVKVSAEVGTVIEDAYVPKIMAENNTATFTVGNGGSVMTVRVYGFTGYERPQLFEKVGGKWVEYDTSHYEYDGYMVYNDGDGTFSYSFCIDMSEATARTFKISGGN